MLPGELIHRYPVLYHMAEAGSWDNIAEYGLLSTSALLDLYQIQGQDRLKYESSQRPTCMTIQHPVFGTAVIRDQKVMNDRDLRSCLVDGLTPQDWYELLNRKTFFWATEERLCRMLGGREYASRPHWVITVDTSELVNRHIDVVTLAAINTGVSFDGNKRGLSTFQPLRNNNYRDVVEVAVEYSVPDILDIALYVTECQRTYNEHKVIWER